MLLSGGHILLSGLIKSSMCLGLKCKLIKLPPTPSPRPKHTYIGYIYYPFIVVNGSLATRCEHWSIDEELHLRLNCGIRLCKHAIFSVIFCVENSAKCKMQKFEYLKCLL